MTAEQLLAKMTLQEKAAFCSGADFWHTKAIERLGVPSVMMCDGPHGLRKQEGAGDHLGLNDSIETVCYPTAAAMASSFDCVAMARLGKALGRECQAEGISMLLGPGVNIKRSPLCGRNFEYLSEDPCLAGQMAAAYIRALQEQGVSACVKHLACNNQETLRMTGDSRVDERTLHEIYLPAFEAAVKEGGARSIMCAYNAVNGTFCAENKALLTDVLRDQWDFEGMVVTDWGAVKGRAAGIAAGLDLEMPGSPASTGDELVQAVKDGTLAEADLDRAVLNLLRFILQSTAEQQPGVTIDRDACRRLSRELAGECAVLMKNDGALPLDEGKTVAFIGAFAAQPRYQGAGSSHINVPHAVSAMEAAQGLNVVYAQGYDPTGSADAAALREEAVRVACQADTAVIFAGLTDDDECEGVDRTHMKLPDEQNALIEAITAIHPRTVVVLHGGSPMELPWQDRVQAILCMYLGGEQTGAAAVDLLYGSVNPSGHLAETWPLKMADNPAHLNFPGEEGVATYAEGIFTGYRYYDKKEMDVAYPFGHGLSYTSFSYSNLRADKTQLRDTDMLQVQVDVTNTGSRPGKVVVQLYVRDHESTVRRPIRELKAFEKVLLQPSETATVTFTLDKRAFAYWEPKCSGWYVESGAFELEIGESSRDIRQHITIMVEGTTLLPFIVTETTTIGQLMKHPKGTAFISQMLPAGSSTSGDKTVQAMITDMPLTALVSYGRMTPQQLQGLIQMLNA